MPSESSILVNREVKNICDWLFVDDHCEELYRVFHGGDSGEVYNIGVANEYTNIDIVCLDCRELDKEIGRIGDDSCEKLINYVTEPSQIRSSLYK